MFNRKFISISLITCMTIVIFSKTIYALEDDFLKFLINSSYPEVKVTKPEEAKEEENIEETITEDKEEEKDNGKKESSKQDKSKQNEDEFINMYVGEENIPSGPINVANTNGGPAVSNPAYKDNVLITGEKPNVLIYHTHGGEHYADNPEGNYHSDDRTTSTMEIGALLTQELTKRGRGVVHNTTYHDIPEFNGAYGRSLPTIQAMQKKYNSIDIVIDLHRDGRTIKAGDATALKKFHDEYVTTINGQQVARFLFVVGNGTPNVDKIDALATNMTNFAESKYPGITRSVVRKKNSKFNQFTSDNHLLIEVGGMANTLEEVKASVPYIAEILDEYFNQQGI